LIIHKVYPARRGAWARHEGQLPVVEATVILLQVAHLAHPGAPKPTAA
jgi:hypothetical protein